MTIVYAEKGALWPLLTFVILRFWFHDIQYYCNTVFIIVTNDTLIRICTVSCDKTVPLIWILGVLILRQALALARFAQVNFTSDLIELEIATTKARARCHIKKCLAVLSAGSWIWSASISSTLTLILIFVFWGSVLSYLCTISSLKTATTLISFYCMLWCCTFCLIICRLALLFNF